MTFRPTRSALLKAALRGALVVLPGALLVYAAWSSGVIVPGVFGAPLILLGVLIFANPACSRMQLDSRVLIGQSLLGRTVVRVDEITKIVPINLSYKRPRGALFWFNRPARMFEVRTAHGPTGLWLNPNLYGDSAIEHLLGELRIEPEAAAEDRSLEVFSRNRDYGTRAHRR